VNFRFWKPKWGIFSKFLASVLVLSLTLLISPGCSALKRVEGEVEDNTEEVKLIPQSSEHIFIGVIPWVGWTPFIVAEEKGFFKDEGLDVKVVVFPDPQSRHNAFMAGNIQFCGGSTGDYVLQAANGYPITIIMETDCDNTGIIITKYEFNDLSGLRGRTVACKIESMDYFFLERALEMYRLTTDDVTVMDTTPREGIIAFMKGNVDAVVSWWQPLAHEAVKGGKGKVFMTSGDIPEILTDCVCVQNKFLKENPEAIIKVLKCWFRACCINLPRKSSKMLR
jgi:NitT/TauT family transport system substrate-binding protein